MPYVGAYTISEIILAKAVEKSLLEFGVPIFNKVQELLEDELRMEFIDCVKHPNKLARILNDVFGKSSIIILDSIEKNLMDTKSIAESEEFLRVMNNVITVR